MWEKGEASKTKETKKKMDEMWCKLSVENGEEEFWQLRQINTQSR